MIATAISVVAFSLFSQCLNDFGCSELLKNFRID